MVREPNRVMLPFPPPHKKRISLSHVLFFVCFSTVDTYRCLLQEPKSLETQKSMSRRQGRAPPLLQFRFLGVFTKLRETIVVLHVCLSVRMEQHPEDVSVIKI